MNFKTLQKSATLALLLLDVVKAQVGSTRNLSLKYAVSDKDTYQAAKAVAQGLTPDLSRAILENLGIPSGISDEALLLEKKKIIKYAELRANYMHVRDVVHDDNRLGNE